MPEVYKLIIDSGTLKLQTAALGTIGLTGIKDNDTGTGQIFNNFIDWKLLHYSDTAANLLSINPILSLGQFAIESDSLLTIPKLKIGDGITTYNMLPYFGGSTGSFIPLSGTTPSNDLTGRIGYEPATSDTTALSSATRKDFAIGSGDDIDLIGSAINYAYLWLNPIYDSTYGNRISLEAGDSNTGTPSSSFIVGSRKTELLNTFATYAGLQYESATATRVTTNQTALSVLHRAANDARYLLASAALTEVEEITTLTTTSGGVSTLTLNFTPVGVYNLYKEGVRGTPGKMFTRTGNTLIFDADYTGDGVVSVYKH